MSRSFTWLFLFAGTFACGDGVGSSAPDARSQVPPVIDDLGGFDEEPACLGARQTGCASGEKCAIASDTWACVAEGTQGLGEACREDIGQGDDCVGGLHCYQGTCQELCTYADICTDRFSLCIPIPSDAEQLGICLTTCDPVAQDCADTESGERQGCYLSVAGPVCAPVAESPPLVPGLGCSYLNQCAIGSGCVELGGRSQCAAYCDFESNADLADPRCAVDDVCRYLEGGAGAGVCTE